MSQVHTATYSDGMLKLDVKLNLASGARVHITVQPLESSSDERLVALEELEQLCAQLPVDSGIRLTRDQLHERH